MRPLQHIPQRDISRDVNQSDTNDAQKFSKTDIAIITGSAVGGLVGLILIAWLLLPVSAVIVPFVVASALPLFTLLAIIYQAVVYRRQWHSMREALKQTDRVIDKMDEQLAAMTEQLEIERAKLAPRLQITSVRVTNLKPEEEPIFILSLKNIGALDAEGVVIHMRVSFGKPVENVVAQKLSEPQTITVPAGQEQTYAIPWDQPVTEEHLKRLYRIPLIVSGFIQLRGEKERQFCYRYYALKGERPQGVPEFVPCDFDTRLTRVVTPGTANLKVTAHAPDVIVKPSPHKEAEPEDKTEPDSEDNGEAN